MWKPENCPGALRQCYPPHPFLCCHSCCAKFTGECRHVARSSLSRWQGASSRQYRMCLLAISIISWDKVEFRMHSINFQHNSPPSLLNYNSFRGRQLTCTILFIYLSIYLLIAGSTVVSHVWPTGLFYDPSD